jgi:phosphoribosylglycinamide formyltransferase-1
MHKLRISVLVSGGGTDLQSIIDAIEDGSLENVEIVQVISSKADAYALERAAKHGLKGVAITKADYPDIDERMDAIIEQLEEEDTELVVMAGYLSILNKKVVEKYKGRIINIHPSLLPLHGGKDCYGIKVHEQVIAAGEKESGATVHFVDEGIDTGEIILQRKVAVEEGDTAETLQKRVLELEHEILPEAIGLIEKRRN